MIHIHETYTQILNFTLCNPKMAFSGVLNSIRMQKCVIIFGQIVEIPTIMRKILQFQPAATPRYARRYAVVRLLGIASYRYLSLPKGVWKYGHYDQISTKIVQNYGAKL